MTQALASWSSVIAALKAEGVTERKLKIAAAPEFQRAVPEFEDANDARLVLLLEAVGKVQFIVEAGGYLEQDPGASLVKNLNQMDEDKRAAVEHIQRARELLSTHYELPLDTLLAEITADRAAVRRGQVEAVLLNAQNIKRRGLAASSGLAAMNGAAIREIAPYVPETLPARADVIADLVGLCGLSVETAAVAETLKRMRKAS